MDYSTLKTHQRQTGLTLVEPAMVLLLLIATSKKTQSPVCGFTFPVGGKGRLWQTEKGGNFQVIRWTNGILAEFRIH